MINFNTKVNTPYGEGIVTGYWHDNRPDLMYFVSFEKGVIDGITGVSTNGRLDTVMLEPDKLTEVKDVQSSNKSDRRSSNVVKYNGGDGTVV